MHPESGFRIDLAVNWKTENDVTVFRDDIIGNFF